MWLNHKFRIFCLFCHSRAKHSFRTGEPSGSPLATWRTRCPSKELWSWMYLKFRVTNNPRHGHDLLEASPFSIVFHYGKTDMTWRQPNRIRCVSQPHCWWDLRACPFVHPTECRTMQYVKPQIPQLVPSCLCPLVLAIAVSCQRKRVWSPTH